MNFRGSALIVAMLAGGCGADGDDPAAWGMTHYVARDGVFSIAYLSPPWEMLEKGASLRLRIAPELFGYDVDVAASTHGLDVRAVRGDDDVGSMQGVESFVVPGEAVALPVLELPWVAPRTPLAAVDLDDCFEVARAELTELVVHHHAMIDFDLVETQTRLGQTAMTFQVITRRETFMRLVYLPSREGVVRAVLVSVFDVATSDVALMLD